MWQMKHALSGGFGGCEFAEWEDLPGIITEEQASKEAYNAACEDYDSYAGLYGLRSIEQIIEEEKCDESEAQDIFNEERESWLDYEVREI